MNLQELQELLTIYVNDMNIEEKLELCCLSTILSDSIFIKRIDPIVLEDMTEKYSDLLDEFIKNYELPINSNKSSLQN